MALMALQPDDDALGIHRPSMIRMATPHEEHMAATLTAPIMAAPQPVDLSAMTAQQGIPTLPTMGMPKVNGPASLPGLMARKQDKLMALQKKDDDPYGSPDNHPGFLGKVLHGLNVATGGPGRRAYEEQGLESRLQDLSKEASMENLQGAEAEKDVSDTTGQNLKNENAPQEEADAHNQSVATTGNLNSETHDRDATAAQGPSLALAYSHAVNQALKAGRDPAQDPVVQHLSDAITSIQRQPVDKPAGMHAVTLDIPGKGRVAGKTDAQGNLLLEDGTVAPHGSTLYQQPNYGELILPTRTQTMLVNGVPTVMGWNEKTQKFDVPMGTSSTGAAGHAMFQAGAIQRAGRILIGDLQDNRDKLGTLGAWVSKYGLSTPIADPELAELSSELQSFAALQPAMHGFRGGDALETFEHIIGDLQKNPDATIASIQGILKTAGSVNPVSDSQTPRHGGNERHRPANVPAGYTYNAKGPHGAGWYKPKAKQ